jgi:D-lactate dehydrogenase
MKVAAFEAESWEQEFLMGLKSDFEITTHREKLSLANVDSFENVEIITTFIYSNLKKPVLEKLPRLKLIACRSTGVDHVDLEYCRENGIQVAHVPDYGQHTVAEHTFGLLLTLSHKLDQAIDRTRRGDFTPAGLQGFDLKGKMLGVLGTGKIGRHVIQIAKGFQMEVMAFDPKADQKLADQLGFTYASLDEVLQSADVITLHVPSNPKTYHLLGEKEFEKMKEGVVILNTARGDVMDVQALVKGLATQKVAAAGLDVLPEEPVIREEAEVLRSFYQKEHNLDQLLADHILLRLRNVIVTPHTAFDTKEAVQRILESTKENIAAFKSEGRARYLFS